MKHGNRIIDTFKWILPYLRPYRKRIAAMFALILLTSFSIVLLPLITKIIIDDGILKGKLDVIVMFSLIALGLLACEKGLGLLEVRIYASLNSLVSFNILKDTFKHILDLRLSYFTDTNSTQILNNTRTDIANISVLFDKSTFYLVAQLVQITGAFIGLVIIDYRLTLLILAILPLRYFLIKSLIRKREALFRQYMDVQSDFSKWYGDVVEGIKEIKLNGLEMKSFSSFTKKQRELVRIQVRMAMYDKVNEAAESFLINAIINALYIIGGWFILGGQLTLGSLMAFISYSIFLTMPVAGFLNVSYLIAGVSPSLERLKAFFNLETEKRVSPDPGKPVSSRNKCGALVFENVSFCYGKGHFSLQDMSFSVHDGQKIAIIGENGSGKTTLINLLLRFISPGAGRITLDGIDIGDYNLKEYRRIFSVISQDLYLFDASIRENIEPHGSISPEKLREVAARSQARSFIESLPLKYDTRVGKNGTRLSGGQRQKLALARALAKEGQIIICDEGTSNVDIETESYINELLRTSLEDKTMIFITHRPLILQNMDRIVILRNGKMEDTGTHSELSSGNGYYRDMVSRHMHVHRTDEIVIPG